MTGDDEILGLRAEMAHLRELYSTQAVALRALSESNLLLGNMVSGHLKSSIETQFGFMTLLLLYLRDQGILQLEPLNAEIEKTLQKLDAGPLRNALTELHASLKEYAADPQRRPRFGVIEGGRSDEPPDKHK